MLSTYGNQTGIVKSPISRPYWMEADDSGKIVFNSQTSNNISVMDPRSDSLVEYHVPSKIHTGLIVILVKVYGC